MYSEVLSCATELFRLLTWKMVFDLHGCFVSGKGFFAFTRKMLILSNEITCLLKPEGMLPYFY